MLHDIKQKYFHRNLYNPDPWIRALRGWFGQGGLGINLTTQSSSDKNVKIKKKLKKKESKMVKMDTTAQSVVGQLWRTDLFWSLALKFSFNCAPTKKKKLNWRSQFNHRNGRELQSQLHRSVPPLWKGQLICFRKINEKVSIPTTLPLIMRRIWCFLLLDPLIHVKEECGTHTGIELDREHGSARGRRSYAWMPYPIHSKSVHYTNSLMFFFGTLGRHTWTGRPLFGCSEQRNCTVTISYE